MICHLSSASRTRFMCLLRGVRRCQRQACSPRAAWSAQRALRATPGWMVYLGSIQFSGCPPFQVLSQGRCCPFAAVIFVIPSVNVVAPNHTVQYCIFELISASIIPEEEQTIKRHIKLPEGRGQPKLQVVMLDSSKRPDYCGSVGTSYAVRFAQQPAEFVRECDAEILLDFNQVRR